MGPTWPQESFEINQKQSKFDFGRSKYPRTPRTSKWTPNRPEIDPEIEAKLIHHRREIGMQMLFEID